MNFHAFSAFGKAALTAAAAAVLAACTPGMTAAVSSVKAVVQGGGGAEAAKLDPNFAYLLVTRGRYSALFWRGLVEKTAQGPVEVYYSGDGEVLRLRDGRIVGVSGVPTEWTRVDDGAPGWSAVAKSPGPVAFVRVRDVMPGYRSGVRDELTLARIAPPAKSALRVVDPQTLTWFEEHMSARAARHDALPPVRYALDLAGGEPAVIYSEQCLAPDFCFTWQRWSSATQASASARPTQ